MRGSRRLWDIAAREKHIWGRCDRWDAKVSGCELNSEYKCSDRISQGPEQYDMEIVLGNLTPSRPDHPVHLAWWAPQKSQTAWNPHDSLEGCAVYRDMNEAYPDFTDPNFNGGNLVVSETGRVTIRVQNPATYFVTHWISVPHIHLRLCSNDTFAHTTQDAIIFVRNGAELVAGEAGSSLQIVSVKNYTWAERPGTGNVSDTGIAGILVWRREGTTTTLAPGQIQQLVEDTMDRMNLDALEFSPIYQCFENDQLYDHFTADCTTSCGGGAEVAHGQCVRPARFSESSVVGIWQLMGTCNEACWSQWKNVTLHDARLALADLLDVPFQEITRVSMTFHASAGRRLSTDKLATFQIMVTTKRLPKNDINTLMRTFLTDSAVAADVMNFPVSEVTMTNMNDRGEWSNVETAPRFLLFCSVTVERHAAEATNSEPLCLGCFTAKSVDDEVQLPRTPSSASVPKDEVILSPKDDASCFPEFLTGQWKQTLSDCSTVPSEPTPECQRSTTMLTDMTPMVSEYFPYTSSPSPVEQPIRPAPVLPEIVPALQLQHLPSRSSPGSPTHHDQSATSGESSPVCRKRELFKKMGKRVTAKLTTQFKNLIRRSSSLHAASRHIPSELGVPSDPPLLTHRIPQATVSKIWETMQRPSHCPLLQFLSQVGGCHDIHTSLWEDCRDVAAAKIRKCCYMAPIPDDIPNFARRLLNIPSQISTCSVWRLFYTPEEMWFVQHSYTGDVLYGDRFKVQCTVRFTQEPDAKIVTVEQWVEIAWDKPLPFTHAMVRCFIESKAHADGRALGGDLVRCIKEAVEALELQEQVAADEARAAHEEDAEEVVGQSGVSAEEPRFQSSGDRTDVIDDRTDPYQGAYDEKEPRNNWQTIGGIPTGDLPVGVIVGVAIAVIFAGFGFGFFILYRRRRAITEIASGERHVTAAGTIIGSGGPAPGSKPGAPL
ncbi:unnamed protein product [Symbiodinium sp. KB8]|nr:unnamed protein product [Symbiodinium sp. KB8]